MIDPLEVRPEEPRGVRLFALDVDQAGLDRLQAIQQTAEPGLARGYLADLLGVEAIDATRVEVFHVDDLSNFGLFNYLIKANGLPEETLEPDRALIEAQRGVVLILYSSAFRQKLVTLNPRPELQLVGAWDEAPPEITFTPLRAAAAKGRLEIQAKEAPPAPVVQPRWLIWALAMLVLAILAFVAVLRGEPQ